MTALNAFTHQSPSPGTRMGVVIMSNATRNIDDQRNIAIGTRAINFRLIV
jgi:hypothetical protein